MKFALRDDDLNFFFNSETIEKNYKEIWDICPVSMSTIPFIKGNWPQRVKEAEARGPGVINDSTLKEILRDNAIYSIGENSELVEFIKAKIASKKVYLTIHAIHHRNEDKVIPQFQANFGIGAEFYTTRDLTEPLAKAIAYLEQTFEQPIEVFTPPQNLLSLKGIRAITNNHLTICGDYPSYRSLNALKLFGIQYYLKYAFFKVTNRGINYPFPIAYNSFKIIGHHRLQPGTNIEMLYAAFENVYNNHAKDGCFVLSTHSYGFDFKMKNSNKTMGQTLRDLIQYAAKKPNVQFVNLKQILERL